MVFSYPTPATPAPAHLAATWWTRRCDGLRRRLLVLVFHSRRCRRRRQLAVSHYARGPVRSLAAGERDVALVWAYLQATGSAWTMYSLACTSSPRRCCSAPFRGPSLRTCFSSPLLLSRNACRKRTVRGAIFRPRPTNPKLWQRRTSARDY